MPHPCCPGPLRRRDFLGAALGLGALNFGDFALAAPPPKRPGSPDTSLIIFWMWGGPAQQETFDPKPDAPEAHRGPFKAIDTRIPGVRFAELFPSLAGVGNRLTVIRSLHHTMASHNDGSIELLTAKTPEIPDPRSTARSKHPDLGMIVSKVRGLRQDAIPQYVGIPGLPFMTSPNYLGVAHKGFTGGDPTQPDPTPAEIKLNAGLTPRALDRRNALLAQLEGQPEDARNPQDGFAKLRQAGVELLTRPEVANAFDIRKENQALRERYGMHLWGQSCLMARRLTEAGAGVVIIDASAPIRNAKIYWSWDDHADANDGGWDLKRGMESRGKFLDQALTTLVQDLYDRGLDKKVLVAAMGEFGRTPNLEHRHGCIGRGHHPGAMTALLSGGGIRTGQAIGSTDEAGGEPTDRPLTPQDLHASFYKHLGIDPRTEFEDLSGRPLPILSHGEPIKELW